MGKCLVCLLHTHTHFPNDMQLNGTSHASGCLTKSGTRISTCSGKQNQNQKIQKIEIGAPKPCRRLPGKSSRESQNNNTSSIEHYPGCGTNPSSFHESTQKKTQPSQGALPQSLGTKKDEHYETLLPRHKEVTSTPPPRTVFLCPNPLSTVQIAVVAGAQTTRFRKRACHWRKTSMA